MFYLNKSIELSCQLLTKMINRFYTTVEPKLITYGNYYNGLQAILQKTYSDPSKPCSRTVVNYCKNIVDSYCGYIATPGCISYHSNDDIEEIMNILRYNDYQEKDAEFLLKALCYGTAAELMYLDETSQVRFTSIEPTQGFGIYDDSLSGDLLYFVRIYKQNEWDDSDKQLVDVYSNYDIKHYYCYGRMGALEFLGSEPHYFSQCPANVFYMPDEKSIFDCVMGLQDAANELLSSEIDDYSAFCDAFLCLSGVDADADDIASMKENRVLVLPEGATASWLTKSANDAQVENILKRIHDSIYRIAQCPDFSSESFVGGVSSGIAIQYRLTGMENRAGVIEGRMKQALQRRIEIISGIASLKMGEQVFRDVQISFKRNIPVDSASMVSLVNSLRGLVSDATLLGQLDFVPDVNAELDAVKEQKQENMKLYPIATIAGE